MTRLSDRRFARRLVLLCPLLAGLATGMICSSARAVEVLSPPQPDRLQRELQEWLAGRRLDKSPVVDAITPLWQLGDAPSAEAMFDALMRTFYIADDDARKLIDACRNLSYSPAVLSVALSTSHEQEPLFIHNLRLFYGRHLATLSLYEEALDVFAAVDVGQVVDPAALLFHQAVCEHHLLQKKEGLATLDRLLENTEKVPDRYRKLGELMQDDLEKVKDKSIDEVARQMKDVERRLSLGRPGEKTQEVERKIIETLDELIKKIEDQQKQSSGGGSGAAQGGAPNNPASDSYLGGIKGEGLTDKKDIGHKDHWGDLPPKAQEAAKNMLDRQFPAHYRQAVEEYLKKLADRPAP